MRRRQQFTFESSMINPPSEQEPIRPGLPTVMEGWAIAERRDRPPCWLALLLLQVGARIGVESHSLMIHTEGDTESPTQRYENRIS